MHSRPHLFGVLAGLFLAAGLAGAAAIVASTLTRLSETNVINVTGSARRHVQADLVLWSTSVTVGAPTLLEAQQRLQADVERTTAFLRSHGVTEVAASPVDLQEITAKRRTDDDEVATVRVGYRLKQRLEVRSADVTGVPRLAAACGPLLEQGVAIESLGFEFIYTKAGEAKVEMMAEATRDARTRAEQIATQGGRSLAGLRQARAGVVQVNPLHSSSTSWDGNNDTTSVDKTITVTVAASFALR